MRFVGVQSSSTYNSTKNGNPLAFLAASSLLYQEIFNIPVPRSMDPSLGLSELGRENQIVAGVIFDIAKSPTGVSMNLLSKSIIAEAGFTVPSIFSGL